MSSTSKSRYGPVLPEAGDRYERGARVELLEPRGAKTEALDRARAKAFDDEVGLLGEAAEDVAAGGGLEVERDASLAGVEFQEHTAAVAVRDVTGERPHPARHVAAVGVLDLEDVGAVVGEQLGGVRPGDGLREVEDADAFQRSHRRLLRVAWRAGATLDCARRGSTASHRGQSASPKPRGLVCCCSPPPNPVAGRVPSESDSGG